MHPSTSYGGVLVNFKLNKVSNILHIHHGQSISSLGVYHKDGFNCFIITILIFCFITLYSFFRFSLFLTSRVKPELFINRNWTQFRSWHLLVGCSLSFQKLCTIRRSQCLPTGLYIVVHVSCIVSCFAFEKDSSPSIYELRFGRN